MHFVENKTAEQQSCVIYISATSPPAPWRGYAVARHVLSLVEGVETSNDGQPEITRERRTFPIGEGWQPAKLSEINDKAVPPGPSREEQPVPSARGLLRLYRAQTLKSLPTQHARAFLERRAGSHRALMLPLLKPRTSATPGEMIETDTDTTVSKSGCFLSTFSSVNEPSCFGKKRHLPANSTFPRAPSRRQSTSLSVSCA